MSAVLYGRSRADARYAAGTAEERTMDLKALSNSSSSSVARIRSSMRAASLSDISSSFTVEELNRQLNEIRTNNIHRSKQFEVPAD